MAFGGNIYQTIIFNHYQSRELDIQCAAQTCGIIPYFDKLVNMIIYYDISTIGKNLFVS